MSDYRHKDYHVRCPMCGVDILIESRPDGDALDVEVMLDNGEPWSITIEPEYAPEKSE